MALINHKIILNQRPSRQMQLSNFKLVETTVPELKDGEVLLKTKYLTADPYMRMRMNEFKSYAEPFKIGDVIGGHAVCVVKASKNPDLQEGELVLAGTGWQTYTVFKPDVVKSMAFDPTKVTKLSPDVKPSLYLGILGMPGLTAWYGLFGIGCPKAGETVVVAAATGPVGSMVGQLAKDQGCYVVGIAGGPQKCNYAVNELGFDVCIDHKNKKMAKELQKACPKGIDIYFETVGGPVFSSVRPLLNVFARVPVIGVIHWYNDLAILQEKNFGIKQIFPKIAAFFRVYVHLDQTPIILGAMIGRRIKYQGFFAGDHFDKYQEFLSKAIPLVQSGKIKAKEDIVLGIDKAPQAFIGLIKGKNFGKVIIEIPDDF